MLILINGLVSASFSVNVGLMLAAQQTTRNAQLSRHSLRKCFSGNGCVCACIHQSILYTETTGVDLCKHTPSYCFL